MIKINKDFWTKINNSNLTQNVKQDKLNGSVFDYQSLNIDQDPSQQRENIIKELEKGNYSALFNLNWHNVEGTADMLYILQEYKNRNGVSLYNKFLQDYNNGIATESELQNNIKNLLEMTHFKPDKKFKANDNDKAWDAYWVCADIIRHGYDLNFEDHTNFDFDFYFDNVVTPGVNKFIEDAINNKKKAEEYKKKAIELLDYDVKNSPIKDKLPQITNEKTEANTTIQTFNGKKYTIIEQNDKLIVKDDNNEYEIDFEKLLVNAENENDKERVKEIIKTLSAPVLIDLSLEIDSINITHKSKEGVRGEYDNINNTLTIVLKDDEPIENYTKFIAHEIGHAVDASLKENGYNNFNSAFNKEFLQIANRELEQLKNKPLWESQYATYGPEEMFAECYALLMTGSSGCSNFVIANYFPETLEYVERIIEEQRSLPIEERCYGGERSIKIDSWRID